jgi:LacI family transcriptional regulator
MTEGLSRRLAREFCDKISSGQWPLGERVPTTRELAATYGVSVNTIQNAFRELEATDLVERRPRLGGFVKNIPGQPAARSIASPRATTIGVVVHHAGNVDASGTWADRIIRGCGRELAEAGFHVAIFSFDEDEPTALQKVLSKIDEAGETLGGVLYFTCPTLGDLPRELDERNIGWVTVNPSRDHATQNFVAQDALHAARLIARCFARMGRDRVLVLGDRIQAGRSTGELYLGFLQGWLESGRRSPDIDFIYTGGVGESHGYRTLAQRLATEPAPHAVLATGDYIAIGAMRALRDGGLEVGRDVHVVGATGLELAQFSHPPLTVSEVPMEAMGRAAAQMLLEMAREGVRRMLGRYLPARLIVRESCPIPAEVVEEESRRIEEESQT